MDAVQAGALPQLTRAQLTVRQTVWLAAVFGLSASIAVLPPVQAAAVVFGLAALLLMTVSPVWALSLVLFAIPLEFVVLDLGAVGLTAIQIVMVLVAGFMVAEMLATGQLRVSRTPLDVPILAWTAIAFLGAVQAVDPAATIKKAGFTLVLAAVFYLVVDKVRRLRTVTWLMGSLVTACAGVGAYGIWVSYRYLSEGVVTGNSLVIGSEGLNVPRASSTVGDPTLLGGLMVVAIPIAVALFIRSRGWMRVYSLLANAVLFVSLGFTFTRGAWMGAVAGLAGAMLANLSEFVSPAVMHWSRSGQLMVERRARATLITLVLAVTLLAPGAVWERAASSGNLGRKEISHRFDYWRGAVHIADKRPLLGSGINNFEHEYARLPLPETAQRNAIHAHNVVLMLLSETGVLGLVAFGAFVAVVLVLLLRGAFADTCHERRLWRVAIAAAILGSGVHQMTDTFLLEPTMNAVLWIFAGLAVALDAGMIDDGTACDAPRRDFAA